MLEKDKEKTYSIYKKLFMLNSWVYGFFTASFYSVITPFVTVWVGEEYILPQAALIAILANFYLQGVRTTINIFKDAAGIFYEDRFMPIIEVISNIIISIVLVKFIGLPGIFIGTVVSSAIVVVYGNARYVYKPLFRKRKNKLFTRTCKIYIDGNTCNMCICISYKLYTFRK